MEINRKDKRIRRSLSLIKRSGRYQCKKCGNKKFILASKQNRNKSKLDWVKCTSCGRQESATTNTFFHEYGMSLSKAWEVLFDVQQNYIDAKDHNESVYQTFGYVLEKYEKYKPLRLSIRKIADQNGMQTKSVTNFFERLKNWLPKQYHQKKQHLKDDFLEGVETEKWREIYTALAELLFDGDEERTESDILYHLVLKEPENLEDWWVDIYPWMVE